MSKILDAERRGQKNKTEGVLRGVAGTGKQAVEGVSKESAEFFYV